MDLSQQDFQSAFIRVYPRPNPCADNAWLFMSTLSLNIERIRRALSAPLPGLPAQLRMAPPDRPGIVPTTLEREPRQAAVLVLLYPKHGELHFVLTRRAERLGNHSGQISLPGGRADSVDANLIATALRETREELGIALEHAQVEVLGELSELYVPPSNFVIHPVVAHTLAAPTFVPNADEVAEVIEVSAAVLLDPTIRGTSPRTLVSQGGKIIMTPHYLINGHIVWGATAMVLSEFEAVLRKALSGE